MQLSLAMDNDRYGEKAIADASLETWDNPSPEEDYTVSLEFPEFTCLCPRSGFPDFATIYITYVPDRVIVELKSLKLYLNAYRDRYMTHEEATNTIYQDIKTKVQPRSLEVIGAFNVRGGVKTTVRCSSQDETSQ
ncbi:MAG: preQ(1) synthase [Thermoplasmatota archaeon]